MLAYRIWWITADNDGQPVLRSIVTSTIWQSTTAVADNSPLNNNESGIHAVLPGGRSPLWGRSVGVIAIGAVDAHGTVVVHTDGVIRSERARILALRVLACGDAVQSHEDTVKIGPGSMFTYVCPRWWPPRDPGIMSVQELEDTLLKRYSVPRLPDGVEPWK